METASGSFWFFHDVTERRKTDQILRDSEAQFRLLFANNPLPMWIYDLQTLEFLEVNEAALDKYGYSQESSCRCV